MFEILVGLLFLFLLWVLGRSLILVCRADDCDWLSMPIGLCLVGLIANMLYFMFGLTIQEIQLLFLCSLFPCLFMILKRGIRRSEWILVWAVLGIFLLLALPAYIGTEQYYVFRGNHWDHFNYINLGLTFWDNPYSIYQNALANKFLSQDVLIHGIGTLNLRPAAALVFALLLPDGRGNIHLLAFLYVTALWALAFPGVCFAWKRTLEASEFDTKSLLLLIGPPFAYVVGFWGQYIFDINSWSQMASLSLLLAFTFEYMRLLQKLVNPSTHEGKSITSEYVVTGLLAAGAFLFYPENTILHAALLLAATIFWFVVTRKIPRFTTVVSLAVFSAGVLLISSIPNWNATVGFVTNQIKFRAGQSPDWWKYFDCYWLGLHGNVLFNQIISGTNGPYWWKYFDSNWWKAFDSYWLGLHIPPVIGCISVFANFVLALIGIFFVTPDYSMPFGLRYTWIGITVIFVILAGYSLSMSLFVRFRMNKTTIFLKIFFLSGVFFLLYLLKNGALWSFGKALSFLSPYLFLILCLSFIETGKGIKSTSVWKNTFGNMIIKYFVIIFIISQIAFGMARLWAARDPNGIGYNFMYPSIQDPKMKTAYRWDMDPNVYAQCHGVYIYNDVDPFYMEYIKQKFTYLRMPYFSSSPVMTQYADGDEVGPQQPIVTDCNSVLIKGPDKWITVKL